MKTMFSLLTELTSSPTLSRAFGAFARSPISRPLIRAMVRMYDIDVSEATAPLRTYRSVHDFFTRTLHPQARPIDGDPLAVVSPVDGVVCACGGAGPITVKGQTYALSSLLGTTHHDFEGGGFVVIYLSPADYHRIHAPLDAHVTGYRHISGTVYPVHDRSLREMRYVLQRNRRVVTHFARGAHRFALVKVGAMNVGAIPYTVHGTHPPTDVSKGEDLAYFTFGSTVVLLWSRGAIDVDPSCVDGARVRMGMRIGTLRDRLSTVS